MTHNILQITNKPPFPSVDGGCLEMAKMSSYYAKHPDYNLTVLTVETRKHPLNMEVMRKSLPDPISIYSSFINTKPTLIGGIKSLLKNSSYNLDRFKTKETEEKLIEILQKKNYDIIQFESIFMGQYYPIVRQYSKAKIILNSPNIEHEIWDRIAEKSSLFKRVYIQKLSKQLRKKEETIWHNMDGIISISKLVQDKISASGTPARLITIPYYLDTNSYEVFFTNNKEVSFFHLGAMDWFPNLEGINWFIQTVWKQLSAPTTLFLAGKGMPDSLKKMNSASIVVEGFVEDAKSFMSQHDVMIVPLLSGSGMRIKIIEAMALGKCVVTTSIGAEGIQYTPNENILIANTPDEFITRIESLIAHPEKIDEIGKNARKLARNKYDITNMEEELVPFITQLLG